jgi:hypothetical protein
VLAWLAPCLAAWYWIAPWLARPAAWLAQGIVGACANPIVDALEFHGRTVVFVTSIGIRQPGGAVGAMLVEVNPLLYSYGAALFAELMLASRARAWTIVAGIALLVPFQAWGIAFDFLVDVGVRSGPEVASRAGVAGAFREFAALAYQIGALVFPALAPIVVWAAIQRRFIASLVRPASGRAPA